MVKYQIRYFNKLRPITYKSFKYDINKNSYSIKSIL